MRVLGVTAFCCLSLILQAQSVRVSARARTRVAAPGATAAYTFDEDCADAHMEGDSVILVGVRPCTTNLIIVTAGSAMAFMVVVSPSQQQQDRLRTAHLLSRGIAESGNLSTYFSSDRNELETAIDLIRTEGNQTAKVSLAVANGNEYSPLYRRTALPHASIQFAGPSATVTLLDGYIPEALITVENARIRGLHVETKNWFLHGGIASLTDFREAVWEKDPDQIVVAGYRTGLSKNSTLAADVQWISASQRYVAGHSGALGSILYRFESPSRLGFQVEAGVGNGVGLASSLTFTGADDHLDLQLRFTGPRLASLSLAPAHGLQANGDWSRSLNDKLSMETSGSKYILNRFDGRHDSNDTLSERMQWRFGRFTASAGLAWAEFSRANTQSTRSLSVPLGLAWQRRSFGNSFQYQFGRNWGSDRSAYLVADSLHVAVKSFTFNAYGGRQTQAPTLDYILANVPGLREALLSAGFSLTSPEDIQRFLSEHADLIARGFISGLAINLAPVRRYAGGSLRWSTHHNRLSVRVESRIDDSERVAGHVTSTNQNVSVSARFGRNDSILSAALFTTELVGKTERIPVVSIGIHRQLGHAPDFLNRFQQHGEIRGIVYSDKQQSGAYEISDAGIEHVLLTMDGTRRTYTNRSGAYSFKFVPEGIHTIEVQYQGKEAYVFTSPPHAEAPVDSTVNFGIGARNVQLFGSVHSDAGRGIEGVVVQLSGSEERRTTTSAAGAFFIHLAKSGEVNVRIDPSTLPPSYVLNVLDLVVSVDSEHPGHADFIVRALRSIAGTVSCSSHDFDRQEIKLQVDDKILDNPFDANGKYVVRDLSSGPHELVLKYGDKEFRRAVKLSAEPANLHDVDFDVCLVQ